MIATQSIIKNKCNISFNTVFEGRNLIHRNVVLAYCKIGYGTYIGENSSFSFARIGRFCSIAGNVRVITGVHPTHTFVSTHPAFFSPKKQSGFAYVEKPLFEEEKYVDEKNGIMVEIGNDVWIGEDVKILGGVRIGDGAVIGAGAVVVRNVEPYAVCAGVPAVKIKKRFSDEQVDFLLKFKWWDRGNDWIRKHASLFQDIDAFIQCFSLIPLQEAATSS